MEVVNEVLVEIVVHYYFYGHWNKTRNRPPPKILEINVPFTLSGMGCRTNALVCGVGAKRRP